VFLCQLDHHRDDNVAKKFCDDLKARLEKDKSQQQTRTPAKESGVKQRPCWSAWRLKGLSFQFHM
jgi:hypothetical protein